MALTLKCSTYLNTHEIVIADSSGFYDATNNATGWNLPTIATPNERVSIGGTTQVTAIELDIDGTIIDIVSGTNEQILVTKELDAVLSPQDLEFHINPVTFTNYYATVGDLADGVHDIGYSITVGGTTYTYSIEVFTYKNVEEDVWGLFHKIATNDFGRYDKKEFKERTYLAYIELKALEYSTRTSMSNTRSLAILANIERLLEFNYCKYE